MRIIGHLDMDAFFAAMEERDNPQLRGLPLVVRADPREGRGRSVVSTANYRAREHGIESAMPISRSWRLSEAAQRRGKPPAVFLGVNWRRYAEVSSRIMQLLRSLVPVVRSLRCIERCVTAPGAVILAAMLSGAAAMPASAQTGDPSTLRGLSGLSADQWQAVNRGEPQARVLETQGRHEVAVVGVTRLRATTACFVTEFQDIENFKRSPHVLRIGKFAKPIRLRDLEKYAWEPGDVGDLRNCRVGNCNVKLPSSVIERLLREVDWSEPDHAAKAQMVLREELFRYLETYLARGNSVLIEYQDKKTPVRLAEEFQGLLDGRPGLAEFAPEFREYLARYPNALLPGVDEFFYWSTESFGLKPVTSITHVAIYHQPGQAVIASKQVYASHYFEGSLGLTVALDDAAEASKPGMYLVYLNRSRIDLLSGFFGGLRRAFLRGRLRDGVKKNLAEVAQKLESSCAPTPSAPQSQS